MTQSYTPLPIDTSSVVLPAAMRSLVERLAKSTHDNWALQRMADGWTYGPQRDDKAKQHPGLVPYEDLSEGEKDYDRRTALETLKAVMALGYEIVKA